MKSTFPPTSPYKTLQRECLMMLPQTSTLPLREVSFTMYYSGSPLTTLQSTSIT
jgi:hypothetical protein